MKDERSHKGSKKDYKHIVNPSAKPSHGKRSPVSKRKERNTKADK